MHLDGFNLNLLVALDTLFETRTLTEAAARLSLTQPALSGALKRLREHYDDPLIVYAPSGAKRTPLGEELAPIVRDLLVSARGALRFAPAFDPATSDAGFTIFAADWMEIVLLKDVLGAIAAAAPRLQVTVRSSRPRPAAELFREGADLVLTTGLFASPLYASEPLFEDRFACIAWRGNPHLEKGLDAAAYAALNHAGMVESPDGVAPADAAFIEMNARRRITIRTSVHAALPHIVIGTDLLAVTSERFAWQAARDLPLGVHALPFAVPPLQVIVQWQAFRNRDPAILWLRDRLRDGASALESHQPG